MELLISRQLALQEFDLSQHRPYLLLKHYHEGQQPAQQSVDRGFLIEIHKNYIDNEIIKISRAAFLPRGRRNFLVNI